MWKGLIYMQNYENKESYNQIALPLSIKPEVSKLEMKMEMMISFPKYLQG